jgi:hypothetical protein
MKKEDIIKKLVSDFGLMPAKAKGASYEQMADIWINEIPKQVVLYSTEANNDGMLSIKLSKLKKEQFGYTNKSGRLNKWFIDNFPLWNELSKGYSCKSGKKEYTKIAGGQIWLDVLEDLDASMILDIYNKSVKDVIEYDEIEIDLDNIIAYYKHTKKSYDNGNGESKFFRYTYEALFIMKLAVAYNKIVKCSSTGKTKHLIPQHYEFSSFGRKYYQGSIRLQACNEMVRHGALGECYALDINASVYAYYQNVAERDYNIDKDIIAVVRTIVSSKDSIRDLLADKLTNTKATKNEKIKLVKTALTALGFGARIDNERGVMKNIIFDLEDRRAFLSDPIIKDLTLFYKSLTSAIIDLTNSDAGKELKADLKAMPQLITHVIRNNPLKDNYDPDEPTVEFDRLKMTAVMAYFYQQEETRIMKHIISALKADGNDTLLWVHDGIYIKNKPDMKLIENVTKTIGTTLTFSCEEVSLWDLTHKNEDIAKKKQIKAENQMMKKQSLFNT